MPIRLDPLIVPSRHRRAAARQLAGLLGVPWAEQASVGPFSPVDVSADLTLDVDEWSGPVPQLHDAFRVSHEDFGAILGRIRAAGLAYRSTPGGEIDHQVKPAFGGQPVDWSEPDGHVWQILTASHARLDIADRRATSQGGEAPAPG